MKKAAKHFVKADQFFIQRIGGNVYMSDGCFILSVPVPYYNVYFRPVSGMYIEIDDREKAARRYKNNNGIPVKGDGCDLAKLIDSPDREEYVNRTSIMMEIPEGRKQKTVRFFISPVDRIAIAEKYAEIAEEAEIRCFTGKGSRKNPIFGDNGTCSIMILPVHLSAENMDELDLFVNGMR